MEAMRYTGHGSVQAIRCSFKAIQRCVAPKAKQTEGRQYQATYVLKVCRQSDAALKQYSDALPLT